MAKKYQLSGQQFGRLTVIGRIRSVGWDCLCSCGNRSIVSSSSLVRGLIRSCGCYSTDVKTKHGHYGTPTYSSWGAMKERCDRPKHPQYHNYGGRGITVCDGFRSDFLNFLNALGERPTGKTLDRIDCNGSYTCGSCDQCVANGWGMNCKWSTQKQQMNNRRNSKLATLNGITKCYLEWSIHFKIPHSTLRLWMAKGLSLQEVADRWKNLCETRSKSNRMGGSQDSSRASHQFGVLSQPATSS